MVIKKIQQIKQFFKYYNSFDISPQPLTFQFSTILIFSSNPTHSHTSKELTIHLLTLTNP